MAAGWGVGLTSSTPGPPTASSRLELQGAGWAWARDGARARHTKTSQAGIAAADLVSLQPPLWKL